jgi:hypothetical protein
MPPCDELRRDAAGLMALDADDPRRVEALRHAAGCEGCQRALAEGAQTVTLLDELPVDPAPRAEVLRAVERQVLAQLAAQRRARVLWPAAALVAGWALAALVLHDGGAGLATLPLLAAAAAVLVAIHAPVVGVAGGILFAALLESAHGFEGALGAATGVRCAVSVLSVATFPVGAALLVAHLGGARYTALELATLATAGALAGQAALLTHCDVDGAAHGLLFHVLAVAVAALAGAATRPWGRASARAPSATSR